MRKPSSATKVLLPSLWDRQDDTLVIFLNGTLRNLSLAKRLIRPLRSVEAAMGRRNDACDGEARFPPLACDTDWSFTGCPRAASFGLKGNDVVLLLSDQGIHLLDGLLHKAELVGHG